MDYKDLQEQLNFLSIKYLKLIFIEYSQYFNQNQLQLFQQLIQSNCIVVEDNDINYKNNQGEDYKSTPLAHGGRVFGDNKIHIYPFILENQSEANIISSCEQILIHELMHYFIRPEYMEINDERLKSVNSDITEALVDMCARDIQVKYGLYPNYNSNYANNVIFIRESLNNIPEENKKMNLVFNGSVKEILNQTSTNNYNSTNEYINTTNKETPFNKTVSNISKELSTDHSQSVERKILNVSANCKNKQESMLVIKGFLKQPQETKENNKQKDTINQNANKKENIMIKKLVKKEPSKNTNKTSSGFVNILLMSLLTGIFIGIVSTISFLIINNIVR